jgi:hypothetical protein
VSRARPTRDPAPSLTPAQHLRVKRHSTYQWRQAVAQQAADRNRGLCVCQLDPALQPASVHTVGGQRRDPLRTHSDTEAALLALVLRMGDAEVRHLVNRLLLHARGDALAADLSELPGFTQLYVWAGHLAPLRASDVYQLVMTLRVTGVVLPAAREPVKRAVYLDAAGAHMWPSCSHSDLWRTTRPMSAVVRHYMRTGRWPDDVALARQYGGTVQVLETVRVPRTRRPHRRKHSTNGTRNDA